VEMLKVLIKTEDFCGRGYGDGSSGFIITEICLSIPYVLISVLICCWMCKKVLYFICNTLILLCKKWIHAICFILNYKF
jgi:hypothetical protein